MSEKYPNQNTLPSQARNRVLSGTVVSDKMKKTVTVLVSRLKKHPKYKKYFRITKKFLAHDETGLSRIGDQVLIREMRPISRHKRWTVIERISAARKREEPEEGEEISREEDDEAVFKGNLPAAK